MSDTLHRTRSTSYGPGLHGPLKDHRRTPAQAKERRETAAKKATEEEYNAAELRVFKEKWAALPPGKVEWPSITRKEVLAELAKTGGRRRTRRGRKHRSTRRR